jgi:hypothetical protein
VLSRGTREPMARWTVEDLSERTRRWAAGRAHLFSDPEAYLAGVEDTLNRLGPSVLAEETPEHPAGGRWAEPVRPAAAEAEAFEEAAARIVAHASSLTAADTPRDTAVVELRAAARGDLALLLAAHREGARGGDGTAGVPGAAQLLLEAVRGGRAEDGRTGHRVGRGIDHRVVFYDRTTRLLDELVTFVDPVLAAPRGVALVVARPSQRQQLVTRLHARGRQVARAQEEGRYIALDAAALLHELVRDGRPDRSRFRELVGPCLHAAAERGTPARVYGEMVALLWEQEQRSTAIALEELWNELAEEVPFALLCGYPVRVFDAPRDAEALRAVCGHHSEVVPAAS